MALNKHWSRWNEQDCRDAVVLIQEQRALLDRWLKTADTDHWRDKAGLSLKAHPIVDDTRTATGR